MLPPLKPDPSQQLVTARICWFVLTLSMFTYGLALFIAGKLSHVEELSSVPGPVEIGAILANTLALVIFYILKNKVAGNFDFTRKFGWYVSCWALSEFIVIAGFIAVFIKGDGNGFIYLTNLLVGIVSITLSFPRK